MGEHAVFVEPDRRRSARFALKPPDEMCAATSRTWAFAWARWAASADGARTHARCAAARAARGHAASTRRSRWRRSRDARGGVFDNSLLYEKVCEADARKNEFLAMLAHELRNPMAPIRNAVRFCCAASAATRSATGRSTWSTARCAAGAPGRRPARRITHHQGRFC